MGVDVSHLGVLGVPTNEPALFALFTLFASDRTITVPTPGGDASGD